MPVPAPVPGLVVRYSYLWHDEYVAGREEGRKDRPCAIIAAIRKDGDKRIRVLVLPITHSRPEHGIDSIEIPAEVKRRLQLDEERSWIVISQANEFVWPGPDLRRIPGGDESSFVYGVIPPKLFATIRNRFAAIFVRGDFHSVRRTQ